jgi:hypothetical protein
MVERLSAQTPVQAAPRGRRARALHSPLETTEVTQEALRVELGLAARARRGSDPATSVVNTSC